MSENCSSLRSFPVLSIRGSFKIFFALVNQLQKNLSMMIFLASPPPDSLPPFLRLLLTTQLIKCLNQSSGLLRTWSIYQSNFKICFLSLNFEKHFDENSQYSVSKHVAFLTSTGWVLKEVPSFLQCTQTSFFFSYLLSFYPYSLNWTSFQM